MTLDIVTSAIMTLSLMTLGVKELGKSSKDQQVMEEFKEAKVLQSSTLIEGQCPCDLLTPVYGYYQKVDNRSLTQEMSLMVQKVRRSCVKNW
jgi:hypothetical protein